MSQNDLERRVREGVEREQHVEDLRKLRRGAVEDVMRNLDSPIGVGRLSPERRSQVLAAIGDPRLAREWRIVPAAPAAVSAAEGFGGGIFERTYHGPSAGSVLVGPGEQLPPGARTDLPTSSLADLVDGQLANYREMKRGRQVLREWGGAEPADAERPFERLDSSRADWMASRVRHELAELRRRSAVFTDDFQTTVEQVVLRGDPNEAAEYEVVSVKVPRGPEGGASRLRLELYKWPAVPSYPDASDADARAPKGQPVIAKRQSLRQFVRNVGHVWDIRTRFAGGRTDDDNVESLVQPTLQRLI